MALPLQNVEKPADMRDQADLFGSEAGGNTSLGQHFGLQVTRPGTLCCPTGMWDWLRLGRMCGGLQCKVGDCAGTWMHAEMPPSPASSEVACMSCVQLKDGSDGDDGFDDDDEDADGDAVMNGTEEGEV